MSVQFARSGLRQIKAVLLIKEPYIVGNHFVPVSIFSIKVSDGGALTGGVPFVFYGSSFAKIVARSSLAVTRNVTASRHIEVENPHFR